MNVLLFRPISAWVPIAMSLGALSVIAFHLSTAGAAPQADEGAAAHLWQLLIAGQAPLLIHAVKWAPARSSRRWRLSTFRLRRWRLLYASGFLLRWIAAGSGVRRVGL